MALLQKVKDLNRIREIVQVLSRYGFGYFLEQTSLYKYLNFGSRLFFRQSPEASRPLGERLRLACEELGPTFIKLGQILSTRLDMFPEEIIEELSRLQDQVLFLDGEIIVEALRREFDQPFDKIFSHFEKEPAAAASIAQVHRATLFSGESVVVKVKRPGIDEVIEQDVHILKGIIEMLEEKFTYFRDYNFSGIFQEFSRSLHRELDFRIEARNILRFAQNLSPRSDVYIPEVFFDYTTENALVMEHLEGAKVTDFQGNYVQKKILAERGANAVFKQVFVDGLFHGDPHPGNIFILPDKRIAFVDFGIIGRMDGVMKQDIRTLLIAILARDSEKLASIILKMCRGDRDDIEEKQLKADLIDILDSFYGLPLEYIQFHQVISELFQLARRYKLYIPSEYTLMVKALLTIEKIASGLDPEFNLIDSLGPFMENHLLPGGDYSMAFQGLATELSEWAWILPSQLKNILEMLERGKIKFEFKQRGLEFLHQELSRASKRITAGLVLCSLIIGSALIITAPHKGEYMIWGYDALGLIGFFIASCLGVLFSLSVFR